MSQLHNICSGIQEGSIIIDGLFSLVEAKTFSKLGEKLPEDAEIKRDIFLSISKKSSSILQKYWLKPANEAEVPVYLAAGRSFVEFIYQQYGRGGIAILIKQLAHIEEEPLKNINIILKRKTLNDLEIKWMQFLHNDMQEKFKLSWATFVKIVLKYTLRGWGVILSLAFLFLFLLDSACYLYNAIAFGEVSTITSLAAFSGNLSDIRGLVIPASLLVGTILVRFVSVLLMSAILARLAVRVSMSLRRDMIISISKDVSLFLDQGSSEAILSAFSQDISQVENGIGFVSVNVFRGPFLCIISICFVMVANWMLGIPLLFLFLLMEFALGLLARQLAHHSFVQGHATNQLSVLLGEVLDGSLENRLFGLLEYWLRRFRVLHHSCYKSKGEKSIFFSQAILVTHYFLPILLSAFLLVSALVLVVYNMLTFNLAMTCFILFSSSCAALRVSGSLMPAMQKARISLGRVFAYIKVHTNHRESKEIQHRSISENESDFDIALQDVCFAYSPSSAYWQLFDITVHIRKGEKVAIVGLSGSGKSTLLKVILGLLQPTKGEAWLCSCDMQHTMVCSLPVGVVSQNSHFFQLTISDNLKLGNSQSTQKDIIEATKLAGIHDWIESLPQGYDSILGEGATSMSNGQKQRLALARALLRQPQVLLLDEFTSALDRSTGASVFQRVMELSTDKTVLSITHDLHQASKFDTIILLSHGVVKERGTHKELLNLKGYYYKLWTKKATPIGQPVLKCTDSKFKIEPSKELDLAKSSAYRRASLPNIYPFPTEQSVSSKVPVRVKLEVVQEREETLSNYSENPLSCFSLDETPQLLHKAYKLKASTPKITNEHKDISMESAIICPPVPPSTPFNRSAMKCQEQIHLDANAIQLALSHPTLRAASNGGDSTNGQETEV